MYAVISKTKRGQAWATLLVLGQAWATLLTVAQAAQRVAQACPTLRKVARAWASVAHKLEQQSVASESN